MRLIVSFVIALSIGGAVLALTPKERAKAQHARDGVEQGIEHNNLLGQQLQQANQSASDSATSAQQAEDRALTAEKQAKDQHDELVRAATENAYMRPIVKQVNSWWGVGAIIYGFKRLAVHMLILTAVLIVLGILLMVFVPAAIPIIRLAFSTVVRFLEGGEVVVASVWSRVWAMIQFKRKPVPAPPVQPPTPAPIPQPPPQSAQAVSTETARIALVSKPIRKKPRHVHNSKPKTRSRKRAVRKKP